MTMPRCAVIGAGAAGVGAVRGIAAATPGADITVYDEAGAGDLPHVVDPDQTYSDAYLSALKAALGASVPPKKSKFGLQAEQKDVENWGPVWTSNSVSGLTDFWGGSAVPFPREMLAQWPIPANSLEEDYKDCAVHMAVSGAPDALDELWPSQLYVSPPLPRPGLFDTLLKACERAAPQSGDFKFVAGNARQAVETRETASNACIKCGQCMSGCAQGAIYSARAGFASRGFPQHERVTGRVVSIDAEKRTLTVKVGKIERVEGPFDYIFVAGGCIGSTQLLAGSSMVPAKTMVTDNTICTLFLFKFWPLRPWRQSPDYHAQTAMVVAGLQSQSSQADVFVQLYPVFDFIWLAKAPKVLRPLLRFFGRFVRENFALVRFYASDADSQQYQLSVENTKEAHLSLARAPNMKRIKAQISDLRRFFLRAGAWVLPWPFITHGTSSHYAATLPIGGDHVEKTGEVRPGIYVCDSAAFPNSPAYSPTLTIMAFARWVARSAILRRG